MDDLNKIYATLIGEILRDFEALKSDYKNVVSELTNVSKEDIDARLKILASENANRLSEKIKNLVGND